jgi:hypothetical protein
MTTTTRMNHEEVLRARLAVLRSEHQDLDHAIEVLQMSGRADPLTLRRMKKQKLHLKDNIAAIVDELFPDIIA